MRRSSVRGSDDDGSGSFELLLDTMCNTFGGIVFIALLLTILSQSVEIKTESDINKEAPANIEQRALLKRVEQVKQKISLKEQQEQLTRQILVQNQLLASSKESLKALEQYRDQMVAEIAASESLQQRELRLPRLHPIKKSPVFLAISQGRIYCITDISYAVASGSNSSWGRRGYDSSDVFISEYQNRTTIELLAGRGEMVKKGAEKRGKFHQALSNINKEREFITFAVYPDSFAQFNYVKEIFIDRGFDYNWFIIKDRLSLVKGGGEIHAQ